MLLTKRQLLEDPLTLYTLFNDVQVCVRCKYTIQRDGSFSLSLGQQPGVHTHIRWRVFFFFLRVETGKWWGRPVTSSRLITHSRLYIIPLPFSSSPKMLMKLLLPRPRVVVGLSLDCYCDHAHFLYSSPARKEEEHAHYYF
jgi:hypothetical protein